MMIRRELLALTHGVRGRILLTTLIGLAVTATYVGQGVAAARGLAGIFSGGSLETILPILLALGALIIARAALHWLKELSSTRTAAAVKQEMRRRLYSHLVELGPGYLERRRSGQIQSTVVDGVEALEGYFGYYLPQLGVALVGPLFIVAYLFTLDPIVGVLMLACVMLVPLAGPLWRRMLGERGSAHWAAYSALNAQFLDSMQGMTTLKAFNASARRGEELHGDALRLYRATMAQMAVSLAHSGIMGLAMSAGAALAVGVGVLHLLGVAAPPPGGISLIALLTILFLAGECFRPLTELEMYWHQGFMGVSASGGILAFLRTPPEVKDPAPGTVATTRLRPAVAFHDVWFAYEDGQRPALRGLSFEIAPGETVALVGRSGAGKSTVVSLLLRFLDPERGSITLDGRDLRDLPLAAIRQTIALVSQDTYLFHGTVAENLRLAKPGASEAELVAAARAANAHEFISSLPLGYDTIVGERGMKLSGGERQRVAIARALLKDAPLLVLDEATSSVDAANEAAIQEALDRLSADRTTLVIAHRLSTVAGADRIVVLDAGVAVERGRHPELIANEGPYARLVAAQKVAV